MSVKSEIESAEQLGAQLEELVVRKGQCPTGDRETLLIGYWSLIFDFHKGILSLLSTEFYGSAFALVRPVVEVVLRSHLAVMGTDDEVKKLYSDDYKVNFKDLAPRIDKEFGLNGLLERIMDKARRVLHSYTHGGVSQLGRRFKGNDLRPNYSDDEIIEVVRSTTSMVWMVNNLVTKRFQFEDEWKASNELFNAWGKRK
ncbi:MAG TPA: hypothetical protein VJW20_07620 [Candidatus Angelobacter sp.]|nr:hypothetical protein [Candidatus Angelobacter sp.]